MIWSYVNSSKPAVGTSTARPFEVISGHRVTSASCPLFLPKRTFIAVCTSAKCQKRK